MLGPRRFAWCARPDCGTRAAVAWTSRGRSTSVAKHHGHRMRVRRAARRAVRPVLDPPGRQASVRLRLMPAARLPAAQPPASAPDGGRARRFLRRRVRLRPPRGGSGSVVPEGRVVAPARPSRSRSPRPGASAALRQSHQLACPTVSPSRPPTRAGGGQAAGRRAGRGRGATDDLQRGEAQRARPSDPRRDHARRSPSWPRPQAARALRGGDRRHGMFSAGL